MAEPPRGYLRFTRSDRLEHWAQILTFIPLAVTGLVQRYPGAALSQGVVDLLGGIEATRILHRVLAAVLMLAVVYHLAAIGYRRFVLRQPRAMSFGRADVRAAAGTVAYLLGRREKRPEQGRYTFEEKIEYWSLAWGTILMIVTGFMLWNPIATAKLLPGQFIPAARSVHGFEALLAVLAVVVWHVYHVHLRHFNRSMFTGYLSREEMERYHPLELAALEANPPVPAAAHDRRRRRQRYLPASGLVAVVLLGAIYLFVTFEETAIETIEPIEGPAVFAPISTSTTAAPTSTTVATTTTAVAAPTTSGGVGTTVTVAAAGWSDIRALLDPDCGSCHGRSIQMGGFDLSTYEAALAGGDSGSGVVPGDPDASAIVSVQVAGGHPAQLADAEIATLVDWITAGAPAG